MFTTRKTVNVRRKLNEVNFFEVLLLSTSKTFYQYKITKYILQLFKWFQSKSFLERALRFIPLLFLENDLTNTNNEGNYQISSDRNVFGVLLYTLVSINMRLKEKFDKAKTGS